MEPAKTAGGCGAPAAAAAITVTNFTLYELGKRTLTFSRVAGIFTFHDLQHQPQLQESKEGALIIGFKWRSWSTFYHLLILAVTVASTAIATPIFYGFMSWSKDERTATESSVHLIILVVNAICGISLRLESLQNGGKYVAFWNRLENVFRKIQGQDQDERRRRRRLTTNAIAIGEFHQKHAHLPIVLLGAIIMDLILLAAFIGPVLITYGGSLGAGVIISGLMLIWNFLMLTNVFNPVLMRYIISALELCFQLIGEQCQQQFLARSGGRGPVSGASAAAAEIKSVNKVQLKSLAKLYLELESLIEQFNSTFGFKLFIYIGTFLISFTTQLFFVFSYIILKNTTTNSMMTTTTLMASAESGRGHSGSGLEESSRVTFIKIAVGCPPIIIYITGILLLCTKASDLTQQATKCLRMLKSCNSSSNSSSTNTSGSGRFRNEVHNLPDCGGVHPQLLTISASNYFIVNKQLVISLFGTVTTYLVILVQFRLTDSK